MHFTGEPPPVACMGRSETQNSANNVIVFSPPPPPHAKPTASSQCSLQKQTASLQCAPPPSYRPDRMTTVCPLSITSMLSCAQCFNIKFALSMNYFLYQKLICFSTCKKWFYQLLSKL